jgi:TolB protein
VDEGSRNCCSEIFVMNADGSGLTQITHDQAHDSFPSWSPDGSKIVFSSYQATQYVPGCELTKSCPQDLYVIGADGTGEHRLTEDPADEATPTWSPNGTKIAYVFATQGSPGEVWVMNADGTGAHDLVSNEGGLTLFAEWSPDGSRILYLSAPPGRTFAVWVANADGTGAHQLIDTNDDTTSTRPVWSPDGTQIAFGNLVGGELQLWLAGANGSDPHEVADYPSYGVLPIAWQPISSPGLR